MTERFDLVDLGQIEYAVADFEPAW